MCTHLVAFVWRFLAPPFNGCFTSSRATPPTQPRAYRTFIMLHQFDDVLCGIKAEQRQQRCVNDGRCKSSAATFNKGMVIFGFKLFHPHKLGRMVYRWFRCVMNIHPLEDTCRPPSFLSLNNWTLIRNEALSEKLKLKNYEERNWENFIESEEKNWKNFNESEARNWEDLMNNREKFHLAICCLILFNSEKMLTDAKLLTFMW